jgi:uncharacterized protein DUF3604
LPGEKFLRRYCQFVSGHLDYFGVGTIDEPKPDRWKKFFLKSPISPNLDSYMLEMAPGGLTAWAHENTREAIWDALYRSEVYATSGTRPTVRVFGGWDFTAADLNNPEWVLGRVRLLPRRPHGRRLEQPTKGQSAKIHGQGHNRRPIRQGKLFVPGTFQKWLRRPVASKPMTFH